MHVFEVLQNKGHMDFIILTSDITEQLKCILNNSVHQQLWAEDACRGSDLLPSDEGEKCQKELCI